MNPDNTLSRRTFIQTAGAAAGATLAAGRMPFAYAENEKVRIGCIGTGGQGNFHIKYGLTPASNIRITAVCDVYKPHLDGGLANAGGAEAGVTPYMDYREMLEQEDLDAVVIATPLDTHLQIAVDCLDAGKHIFLEKTLCYTIEDCRKIVTKCHETGRICQVGHQRRYNPEYNKALWLAREKMLLGRVNHVTAQWHRNNDWRRFVDPNYELSPQEKAYIPDLERHINWRLYEESSGGLMTELATHQLDVANWFLGTPPARVSGYGGIDYWRDGRTVFDNIVLIYEYEIGAATPGFQPIAPRNGKQSLAKINRPYVVRATYSSITANAKLGASELIQGDDASVELTEAAGCSLFGEQATRSQLEEQTAEAAAAQVTNVNTRMLPNTAYSQGTPILVEEHPHVDQIQMEAFAEDIRTGGTPKANQMVGLIAAISGLAGMQALREGREVEIDPAWHTFDFDTPDPYAFDYYEEPEAVKEEREQELEERLS